MNLRMCPQCNHRHLSWDSRCQSWLCLSPKCDYSEPSHKPAPPATLGRTIRTIRERIGESPDEMAAKLALDPAFLARLESGDETPMPWHIERFDEVYSVNLWTAMWCFFGDNTKLPEAVQRSASAITAMWDQDMAEYFGRHQDTP